MELRIQNRWSNWWAAFLWLILMDANFFGFSVLTSLKAWELLLSYLHPGGWQERDRGEITPTWSPQPVVGVLHFCWHLVNETSYMAQIKQQSLGNILIPRVGKSLASNWKTNKHESLVDLSLPLSQSSLPSLNIHVYIFPYMQNIWSTKGTTQNQTQLLFPVQGQDLSIRSTYGFSFLVTNHPKYTYPLNNS